MVFTPMFHDLDLIPFVIQLNSDAGLIERIIESAQGSCIPVMRAELRFDCIESSKATGRAKEEIPRSSFSIRFVQLFMELLLFSLEIEVEEA